MSAKDAAFFYGILFFTIAICVLLGLIFTPITMELLYPGLQKCKINMEEFCEQNKMEYTDEYDGYYCNQTTNNTIIKKEVNCKSKTGKVYWIIKEE